MSKERKGENPAKARKQAVTVPPPRGLRPHPKLLLVLAVAFGLWVVGLLGLYFKTVFPYRHSGSSATTETAVGDR